MNKRIKKKKEKDIWNICKNMKWIDPREKKWFNSHWCNPTRLLYKVIKQCTLEKFPIRDYSVHEVPYENEDGVMINLVNSSDYDKCMNNEIGDLDIHRIDFWVDYHKKLAVPQKWDWVSIRQLDSSICSDSIYVLSSYENAIHARRNG